MLASYKKLFSEIVPNPQVCRNLKSFCADYLMRRAERLPGSVLRPERRRGVYFNGVLSRAEVHGSYQPSRQRWLRAQTATTCRTPDCSCAPTAGPNGCRGSSG
ncbi:MAG: Superfamily and helicase with ankyrin domain [Polaromonas sp.]|nr:Superfamily and helicase with ankyrin domain [Polaromonas sp.]